MRTDPAHSLPCPRLCACADGRRLDRPAPQHLLVRGKAFAGTAYLRRMPSTLMKKLPSAVWKPSTASVVPGMTQRMVCA